MDPFTAVVLLVTKLADIYLENLKLLPPAEQVAYAQIFIKQLAWWQGIFDLLKPQPPVG